MMKRCIKTVSTVLVLSSFFYASAVYALTLNMSGNTPDVGTMLTNFSNDVPNLMRLVTAVAYVMGFFFIYKGLMGLKEFGESRTMMSSQHGLGGPLLYLFVGTALIYLPSTVQTGLSTFWDTPDAYGYVSGASDPWGEMTNACFMVIQLVGVIAFIRGLVILTHLGGQGGQPGQFGRAMAHIVGGILCINLYQFLQAVINTLGVGQLQ